MYFIYHVFPIQGRVSSEAEPRNQTPTPLNVPLYILSSTFAPQLEQTWKLCLSDSVSGCLHRPQISSKVFSWCFEQTNWRLSFTLHAHLSPHFTHRVNEDHIPVSPFIRRLYISSIICISNFGLYSISVVQPVSVAV